MVKRYTSPGARFASVSTAVFAAGLSFTTTMLVSEILPLLLTLPVKTSNPPGATAPSGQVLVTRMDGAVTAAQVADALKIETCVFDGEAKGQSAEAIAINCGLANAQAVVDFLATADRRAARRYASDGGRE